MPFDTVRDTEGRLIASLSPDDLTALDDRCTTYRRECERRGLAPQQHIKVMCSAVQHYREVVRGPIAAAFAEFSRLRAECVRRGYAVPPLIGTPHAAQINGVCSVMEQAIRASEPLPGEPQDITLRISDSFRQAIASAIENVNRPAQRDADARSALFNV